jgi:hypothetical protein
MISFALDEGLCVAPGLQVKYDSQLLLACLSLPSEANTIIHDKNKQIRCCDCVNIIQTSRFLTPVDTIPMVYQYNTNSTALMCKGVPFHS